MLFNLLTRCPSCLGAPSPYNMEKEKQEQKKLFSKENIETFLMLVIVTMLVILTIMLAKNLPVPFLK